jgi:hypothetical protein
MKDWRGEWHKKGYINSRNLLRSRRKEGENQQLYYTTPDLPSVLSS